MRAGLQRHATQLAVLGGMATAFYILYLIFSGYQLLQSMRHTSVAAAEYALLRQAAGITYFFDERWHDLDHLAEGSAMEGYFAGQDLGMSMPYGLQLHMHAIKDAFSRLARDTHEDGLASFQNIFFMDESGAVLVGADAAVAAEVSLPDHRDRCVVADPAAPGASVFLIRPLFYKDVFRGRLVARLDLGLISDRFLGNGVHGNPVFLAIRQGRVVDWVGEGAPAGWELPPVFDGTRDPDRTGGRIPVTGTPLELVMWLSAEGEGNALASPIRLLLQWGLLALLVLTGTVLLLKNRDTALLYRANAKATLRQKCVLEDKNRQLEAEIRSRKTAEIRRQKAMGFLHNLIDTLHDPLFCKDEQHRWIIVNTAYCELIGRSTEEVLGSTVWRHFSKEEAIRQEEVDTKVFATGEAVELETCIHAKGALPRTVLVKKSLVHDADGRKVLVGTIRDISTRKETELALVAARNTAEAATQAKTDFLAGMSHEIRNPLNAVIGLVELMRDTDLDGEQEEYLDAIHHASEHLMGMISGFLDVSKIEAGRLELEEHPFSLRRLLRELIRGVAIRAGQKGVAVRLHIASDVPDDLIGDALRLNQILMNLLGNAEKFTHKGMIRLDVRRLWSRGNRIGLVFSVMDTGIGIPLEKQEDVFSPFIQTSADTTRKFGGTGLGLGIARELVRLMGGRIRLKSPVTADPNGPGTCFHVAVDLRMEAAIPAVVAAEVVTGEVTSLPAVGQRILLAEDNPLNQMVTERMLQTMGCEVVCAATGREALDLLGEEEVDLILMDVEMPEMDGPTAAREIRKRYGHSIPIVAQTGHALAGDRERLMEAGMDDYLSKPIGKAALRRVMENFLPHGNMRTEEIVETEEEGMRIDLDIDFEDLMARMGFREDLAHRVMFSFLKVVDAHRMQVEEVHTAGDAHLLREALHKLRGSLLQVSAGRSSEIALAMETACVEGNAERAISQLQDLCLAVETAKTVVAKKLEELGNTPLTG